MDAQSSPHPDARTLHAYGLGKLDDGPTEAVNQHLEQCPDCRARVAETSADSFLERVRGAEKVPVRSPAGPIQAGGTMSQEVSTAPAPLPADTLPQGLIDHPGYEIVRELGRGGMGVVYLAHNTLMGRDEVLKVMGQEIVKRPGVLERFLREIRAVAKLRHANIVTAYSATRVGDSLVLAMEYVEGLDLAKLVKAKGPLPIAHACHFIGQAALGLQHAHEEGLVHRDIKPGNLMLSRKGDKATIKVLDFGLAKVTREEKVDGALTSEGQALGTPDFIAPEQIIDAQGADIRADIYSLGGTLYYLLTGRPPFPSHSLYDIYQAHISRDADPLNQVRPEVPSELAALVAKMMAKDPARRFQTPGEVVQALTPFFKKTAAGSKPRPSVPGQPGPRRGEDAVEPSPTKRPANTTVRTLEPKRIEATSSVEGLWDGLIDAGEAASPDGSVRLLSRSFAPKRPERPRWILPTTAALAIVALVVAGVFIIKIKSKDGEIVLKDPTPGTTVTVEPDKAIIVTGGVDAGQVPPAGPAVEADAVPAAPAKPPVAPAKPPVVKVPSPDDATAARVAALAAALDKTIPMRYAKPTSLADVLKDIQDATKGPNGTVIPIYVDPFALQDAEKTMASTIAINLEGAPLKHALHLALAQLGLDYCAREGLLTISTGEGVSGGAKREIVAHDGSPENEAVLAALERPIPVKYPREVPLEYVVNDLKKALKATDGRAIPIYVDPDGLHEADKSMNSKLSLDLEGLPLRITLRLLLRQLGMDYYVKSGILIISDWEAPRQYLK